MIELEMYSGADETYTFNVLDATGQPIPDDVEVQLRVVGVGVFSVASGSEGSRTIHLEEADTEQFPPGIHHAQLVAMPDSGPRVADEVVFTVRTLIPEGEES